MSSPPAVGRKILSVVGPHSGCGKTTFVIGLLREMSGLGCLKISPAHDWPSRQELRVTTSGDDYYLEPPGRLDHPEKDTALYAAAGAVRAERLRHRRSGLGPGLQAALQQYPSTVPVIVESSSAVRFLDPVAVVLVVRLPIKEMKPGTEAILPRVTDLLINASDRDGSATMAAERLQQQFPALRPRFTWPADLIAQPPPTVMVARLGALLRP